MNYWLIIIPVTSAIIGWVTIWITMKMIFHPRKPKKVFGIGFQGIFPKRQQQLAEKTGKLVSDEFFSSLNLEQKINDPGNLEKVLPLIEKHVDDFLRFRLGEEMPMLKMFIGDKTISSLKKIFMLEIETLFPQVMKQYASNLQQELNLEQVVVEKIAGLSSDKLEEALYKAMSKELLYVKITGAVIGFIIGIIQLAVILFTS
jgi:uncharacterized membrane protein YheB (UPF0754 family)